MIVDRETLKDLINRNRHDLKVGLTGGAFDLFHAGHVELLQKASKLVDVLIVAVNSDLSIKRYKSKDRPVVPEGERIKVVNSCKFVDFCFLFDEENQFNNLKILEPDVFIKGGDYTLDELTRIDQLDKLTKPPEVVIIPRVSDLSTTNLIAKLRNTRSG